MRLNFWIAIGVFLAGLAGFAWSQLRTEGAREVSVRTAG
jgi:hypothetical protein